MQGCGAEQLHFTVKEAADALQRANIVIEDNPSPAKIEKVCAILRKLGRENVAEVQGRSELLSLCLTATLQIINHSKPSSSCMNGRPAVVPWRSEYSLLSHRAELHTRLNCTGRSERVRIVCMQGGECRWRVS